MRKVAFATVKRTKLQNCCRWSTILLASIFTVFLLVVSIGLLVTWHGYGPSYHYRGSWWNTKPTWIDWIHAPNTTYDTAIEESCNPFTESITYSKDILGDVICPNYSDEKEDFERIYLSLPYSSLKQLGGGAPKDWNTVPCAGVPSTKDAKRVMLSNVSPKSDGKRKMGESKWLKPAALVAVWAMFISNDITEPSYDDKGNLIPGENLATWKIDASMIYGSTPQAERSVRKLIETENSTVLSAYLSYSSRYYSGLDKKGRMAPIETIAKNNAREIANPYVAVLHTLFVREHNRVTSILMKTMPHETEEYIFQLVRSIVAAEIQKITYEEWLPSILGSSSSSHSYADSFPVELGDPCLSDLSKKQGWVEVEASLLLTSIGHSMMPLLVEYHEVDATTVDSSSSSGTLEELDNDGSSSNEPPAVANGEQYKKIFSHRLQQRYKLADIVSVTSKNTIEDIIYALHETAAESYDLSLSVFSATIAAKNATVGADESIPSTRSGLCDGADDLDCARKYGALDYCSARWYEGLSPVKEWSDVVSETPSDSAWRLNMAYGQPSNGGCFNADLVMGLLSEKNFSERTTLGETSYRILINQFKRLRDCDSGFYLWNSSIEKYKTYLERLTLGNLVKLNTDSEVNANINGASKRVSTGSEGPSPTPLPSDIRLFVN